MMSSVKVAEQAARKLFGGDVSFTVARSPAWGNEDCCVLIYGRSHAAVALTFANVIKGDVKVEEQEGGGFRGSAKYTYSVVTFSAQQEQPA